MPTLPDESIVIRVADAVESLNNNLPPPSPDRVDVALMIHERPPDAVFVKVAYTFVVAAEIVNPPENVCGAVHVLVLPKST